MKNRQRCHHCVACLAVGEWPLNHSLKRPLGGPQVWSRRSMPGRVWHWLVFLLHQTQPGTKMSSAILIT